MQFARGRLDPAGLSVLLPGATSGPGSLRSRVLARRYGVATFASSSLRASKQRLGWLWLERRAKLAQNRTVEHNADGNVKALAEAGPT
jgi:hypothetical protein